MLNAMCIDILQLALNQRDRQHIKKPPKGGFSLSSPCQCFYSKVTQTTTASDAIATTAAIATPQKAQVLPTIRIVVFMQESPPEISLSGANHIKKAGQCQREENILNILIN
jgi:hypothetical protein